MAPSPTSSQVLFSASQIASALGWRRQRAQRALAGIAADGVLVLGGNEAQAFALKSLPIRLINTLRAEASRQGYESIERLIAFPPRRWVPAAPLARQSPAAIERAQKLRAALTPALERSSNPGNRATHLAKDFLGRFKETMGYAITERHWIRLLERTLKRDGGAEDWGRVEIYLDDRPVPAAQTVASLEFKFEGLGLALGAVDNPQAPNDLQRALIWHKAFEDYEDLLATGNQASRVKRALVSAIFERAPWAGKTPSSLDRNFRNKYDRWIAGERMCNVLIDGREDSGPRRPIKITDDEVSHIAARALNCGGRLAQAWRELWNEGKLPRWAYELYTQNPLDKSYMPAAVRAVVGPMVERLQPAHQGTKTVRFKSPRVRRDWSGLDAGVLTQSDDLTTPILCYVPDGLGWYDLIQPQMLPFVDVRSLYIHIDGLLPKPTYSSLDIRRQIIRMHDQFGLTDFYFERGIWKRSLLIKGRDGKEVPPEELIPGLDSLGVKLSHALHPSAKVIEGMFNILQNKMERIRGFCGREQRKDRPDHITKWMAEVKTQKTHPSAYFLSYEELVKEIGKLIDTYNDEPQNGELLAGLSPREGFVRFFRSDLPIKLDASSRYLLATHRVPVVVRDGVRVTIAGQAYRYIGPQTGPLEGRRMFAWFDLEDPSSITLTDLDRKNPITVQRDILVPAYMEAADSPLSAALAQTQGHTKAVKMQYAELKKVHPQEFGGRQRRPVIVDKETAELGEAIAEQKAEGAQKLRRHDNDYATARRLAEQTGMPLTECTPLNVQIESMRRIAALNNSEP
jgi:hypothetical protein